MTGGWARECGERRRNYTERKKYRGNINEKGDLKVREGESESKVYHS